MTTVVAQATIVAPLEAIFAGLTHPEQSKEFDPDVVRVEWENNRTLGAGTRFRQVRRAGKKEQSFELEVTEYVPSERARMVTDTHGTVWDTLYLFHPVEGGVDVSLTMEARAHALLPRLLNPLMAGFFRRGMQKHLDAAKNFLETKYSTAV